MSDPSQQNFRGTTFTTLGNLLDQLAAIVAGLAVLPSIAASVAQIAGDVRLLVGTGNVGNFTNIREELALQSEFNNGLYNYLTSMLGTPPSNSFGDVSIKAHLQNIYGSVGPNAIVGSVSNTNNLLLAAVGALTTAPANTTLRALAEQIRANTAGLIGPGGLPQTIYDLMQAVALSTSSTATATSELAADYANDAPARAELAATVVGLLTALGGYGSTPADLTVKQLLELIRICACQTATNTSPPGTDPNPENSAPEDVCLSEDGWSAKFRMTGWVELNLASGGNYWGIEFFQQGVPDLDYVSDTNPNLDWSGLTTNTSGAMACISWNWANNEDLPAGIYWSIYSREGFSATTTGTQQLMPIPDGNFVQSLSTTNSYGVVCEFAEGVTPSALNVFIATNVLT